MTASIVTRIKGLILIGVGISVAAMGLYIANADDAPGAAVIGFVLMTAAVLLGVMTTRNRLPIWASRTALAIGLIVAAGTSFLARGVVARTPLFAQPSDVPSVGTSEPAPQWAAAVERSRLLVRAAVAAQNLPGASIAVGAGNGVIWAEGFGWRDVVTRTRVTPETRFAIGSAARVISAAAASSAGLSRTGPDAAAKWSPEAIGEPGEDFPPLTMIRHIFLQPLGIAPSEYPLPDERATFYVPATFWRNDTTDPRIGRRLMFMRDLACCADGQVFASTPSDLVRFALSTNADNVDGELAGGSVLSVLRRQDTGIVVAVASNIAYANMKDLAQKVADVFAEQKAATEPIPATR